MELLRHDLQRQALLLVLQDSTLDIAAMKQEGMLLDIVRPDDLVDIAGWVFPETFEGHIAGTSLASSLGGGIAVVVVVSIRLQMMQW